MRRKLVRGIGQAERRRQRAFDQRPVGRDLPVQQQLRQEIGKVIVGQDEVVRLVAEVGRRLQARQEEITASLCATTVASAATDFDADVLIARLAEVGVRDVLDLTLSGQLDLAEHGRLQQALGAAQARVRCLRSDQRDLRLAPTLQDIAALQADGYLGELIHDLREQSTLPGDEARRAQDALAILTGLLIERGARAGAA